MSRKMLLFTAVLFLTIAVRYAFGQEDPSGIAWDPIEVYEPADTVFGVMVFSPILGLFIGIVRVLTRELMPPVLQPLRLMPLT